MVADPKRIIVALDFSTEKAALSCAAHLDPMLCRVKVGKELFVTAGPTIIEKLRHQGFDIFLDLKFHDIPNTVASACKISASLGVWMLNIHALGGAKMMEAASKAIANCYNRPQLIAVTILTSMDATQLFEVGLAQPQEIILKLAQLAQRSGLDGVVCAAQEAAMIREKCGKAFTLVTPGIRLTNHISDDQVRIMTPIEAIKADANYLVIGRPITGAPNPHRKLIEISDSIQGLSL